MDWKRLKWLDRYGLKWIQIDIDKLNLFEMDYNGWIEMHILPLATTISCCKAALQFTLKSQTSLHLQVYKYASMRLCKCAPFALCFVSPKTFKLLFYSRFYPPQKSAAVRHTHGRICRRMSNLGLQGCILAIWVEIGWDWFRWLGTEWNGFR